MNCTPLDRVSQWQALLDPDYERLLVHGEHRVLNSGQSVSCPAKPNGAQDTLWAGQGLTQGQSIKSLNGKYTLILQQDHNLVLYGPSGALWATNKWTAGYVI